MILCGKIANSPLDTTADGQDKAAPERVYSKPTRRRAPYNLTVRKDREEALERRISRRRQPHLATTRLEHGARPRRRLSVPLSASHGHNNLRLDAERPSRNPRSPGGQLNRVVGKIAISKGDRLPLQQFRRAIARIPVLRRGKALADYPQFER